VCFAQCSCLDINIVSFHATAGKADLARMMLERRRPLGQQHTERIITIDNRDQHTSRFQ
jgi:hypothetical protein